MLLRYVNLPRLDWPAHSRTRAGAARDHLGPFERIRCVMPAVWCRLVNRSTQRA
jgi:hypothetical protein